MAAEATEKTSKVRRAKLVRSDLKDVVREPAEATFRHDIEQSRPARTDRHPLAVGDRSNHVPHAFTQGENERRGGRDRAERKRHKRMTP
jgi:hypothetical protein